MTAFKPDPSHRNGFCIGCGRSVLIRDGHMRVIGMETHNPRTVLAAVTPLVPSAAPSAWRLTTERTCDRREALKAA